MACRAYAAQLGAVIRELDDLGLKVDGPPLARKWDELKNLGKLIETADVVSITHHEDAGVPG
jgi:hypothetical protein